MKLNSLVDAFNLEAQCSFDDALTIQGVNTLIDAVEGELSFFTNAKYRGDLLKTKATAVLLEAPVEGCPAIQLVVQNPYAVLARIMQIMYPDDRPVPEIHPGAVVSASADIGDGCHIGPGCIISEGASIGRGTVLYGNCFIGKNTVIGEDCTLFPSVNIYHRITLGDRVRIHANSVIGSDGFGYAQDMGQHVKVPQIGSVRIEDDVEIGSNTSVDRGAQVDTVIGKGSKLDNLIQIAHGVVIGEYCIIMAQVGIAGSTKIGKHCILAGRVALSGHLEVADQTVLMARCTVTKSLKKPGYYAGTPARPIEIYHREMGSIRRIDIMRKKIRELEKCLK